MMGLSAISHEEHQAQMRQNHELSLARAQERYALLERGHEERLAGGELELQQPTPLGNTAPPWLQTLPSAVSSPAAGVSVLGSIQRFSGIDVNFPEPLLLNYPFSLGVIVPGAARVFVLDSQGTPIVRSPRRSWLCELRAEIKARPPP